MIEVGESASSFSEFYQKTVCPTVTQTLQTLTQPLLFLSHSSLPHSHSPIMKSHHYISVALVFWTLILKVATSFSSRSKNFVPIIACKSTAEVTAAIDIYVKSDDSVKNSVHSYLTFLHVYAVRLGLMEMPCWLM